MGGASTGVRPLQILIVEDDQLQARTLKAHLDHSGRLEVQLAASGDQALQLLTRWPADAVVADLLLPDIDGVELTRRIRQRDPAMPVVIITAGATVDRAVGGMRAGATDFLPKPVNVDALVKVIEDALADSKTQARSAAPRGRESRQQPPGLSGGAELDPEAALFGDHPLLDAVRDFARRVARVPHPRILITGESGTGKSLLARVIHGLGGSTGAFVEVNCATFPPHLMESELFGHERGAFTDAKALKRGLVELAEDGTLLLDEVTAMTSSLQAKLLLFLESRQIRRVGGLRPIPVRTRVVAATNDDLGRATSEGRFRLDLLYRLDVAHVEMPPLRQIASVIPDLVRRFVRDVAAELGRPVPDIREESFAELAAYSWPGNARELRNAVERALIFHEVEPLEIRPPSVRAAPASREGGSLAPRLTLEEVERRCIAAALAESQELREAAERLGISRKTLWDKRRRYGL